MTKAVTKGLSERRLDVKRAFTEIYPFLLLCIILDFVGGYFLGKNFDKFVERYPLILLILPSIMDLRGNVFGASGSRISTALHVGYASPRLRDPYVLLNYYLSIVITSLPVVFLLIIALARFGIDKKFLASSVIIITSSIVISYILSSIAAYITIGSYKKGLDPDNVIGPMITTVADIITIPSIVLFMYVYEISHEMSVIIFVISLVLLFLALKNMISIIRREELGREKKLIKEITYVLTVLAIVSLGSGGLLEGFSRVIRRTYMIAIIYPVILDSLGNYGSVIGARASTQYHLGLLRSPLERGAIMDAVNLLPTSLVNGVIMIIIGTTLSSFVYGFTAPIVSVAFFILFILTYVLVSFGVMILSIVISYYSGSKGWDPDNVTIPVITTIADLLGSLYAVILSALAVKLFI